VKGRLNGAPIVIVIMISAIPANQVSDLSRWNRLPLRPTVTRRKLWDSWLAQLKKWISAFVPKKLNKKAGKRGELGADLRAKSTVSKILELFSA
jgi:hypothetical protein